MGALHNQALQKRTISSKAILKTSWIACMHPIITKPVRKRCIFQNRLIAHQLIAHPVVTEQLIVAPRLNSLEKHSDTCSTAGHGSGSGGMEWAKFHQKTDELESWCLRRKVHNGIRAGIRAIYAHLELGVNSNYQRSCVDSQTPDLAPSRLRMLFTKSPQANSYCLCLQNPHTKVFQMLA